MRNSVIRKLMRSQQGFTLTELLATVIVVTLATMMVATGIPSAINAYGKLVDASNAQSLLSTTVNVVRNELGMSSECSSVTGGVSYMSNQTYTTTRIMLASSDSEKFYPNELIWGIAENEAELDPLALGGVAVGYNASSGVSSTSTKAEREFYVTCESIQLKNDKTGEENNVVAFTNLRVMRKRPSDTTAQELAKLDNYEIRLTTTSTVNG